MNRRHLIALLGAAAAAWPLAPAARATAKIVRIGLLSTSFLQRTAGLQAFRERLEQLGYIEGRNLAVEIRDGQGRNDRLPACAADLVDLRADVIVTLGPYAIQAASDATASIPIVFTGIGANFALARSEGNRTGVVEELIESTARRLALLREAIPKLMRVGIIANPDNYGTQAYLQQCRAWAEAEGATLRVYDVRDPDDIAPAFARMVPDRVEAIVAFPDSVIFGQRDRIVQTALRNQLPGVYIYREWVTAGGLFAYGANQEAILAGPLPNMVDKVLKGARPSNIPVEQGKPELFINLKSAKAMGIALPPSLLARANELIE